MEVKFNISCRFDIDEDLLEDCYAPEDYLKHMAAWFHDAGGVILEGQYDAKVDSIEVKLEVDGESASRFENFN